MNQPTEERTSGSLHQWLCATCNLVLKEEFDLEMPGDAPPPKPAPAPTKEVLGRVPVKKVSAAQLVATKAADKAAADKAAAAKAARTAALAREALKKNANASPPPPAPIDLPDATEFVLATISEEVPAGKAAGPATDSPDPLLEPPPNIASALEQASSSLFERVLIADDTALLREIIKDALMQGGISQHVRGCGNGEEFLTVVAESFAAKVPINLVIIDVEMPILNGYQAAIALRAFERGLKVQPAPLVFFTGYACDDTFRKVLDHCQPARYLNKGADSAPPRIAARLVQVLASLSKH
jgi:CheY-like chemotaxis protein